MTNKKPLQRTFKALFAVTGTKEELNSLVSALKLKSAEGTMPNETGRILFKWLVIYADYNTKTKGDCKVTYAYRSTNCFHTSKPKVIPLATALKRVSEDYYFKDGSLVTFTQRIRSSLRQK